MNYIKLESGMLIDKESFQEARKHLSGNAYKLWEVLLHKIAGFYVGSVDYEYWGSDVGLSESDYYFALTEMTEKGFLEIHYSYSLKSYPVIKDGANL